MQIFSKPIEVTLEQITGVSVDIINHSTFFEVKDSLFVFNQIDWGKELRVVVSTLI